MPFEFGKSEEPGMFEVIAPTCGKEGWLVGKEDWLVGKEDWLVGKEDSLVGKEDWLVGQEGRLIDKEGRLGNLKPFLFPDSFGAENPNFFLKPRKEGLLNGVLFGNILPHFGFLKLGNLIRFRAI